MPSVKKLMKENTELIEQNYQLVKRLHQCEIRCTNLEKEVAILKDIVAKQQIQIDNLNAITNAQQQQIDILRNQ